MKNFTKYLTVALAFGLVSPAFAEMKDSVKSQVASFANKKAVVELAEPTPIEIEESVSDLEQTYDVVPAKAPVAKPTPVVVAAPVVNSSEAQTKLQAIKTQEQWVGKLTKQLEGEKNQLIEMRSGLSQAFNLDPKKLEAGKYTYDTKAGKIIEGK